MIKKSTFKKLSRLDAIYYEEKVGGQTVEYVALYDPEIVSEKEVVDFIKKSNSFDYYYCKEIVSMRKEQFESIFLPSEKEKATYDSDYVCQFKKADGKYMTLSELFAKYEEISQKIISFKEGALTSCKNLSNGSLPEDIYIRLKDIHRECVALQHRLIDISKAIEERLSNDIIQSCMRED